MWSNSWFYQDVYWGAPYHIQLQNLDLVFWRIYIESFELFLSLNKEVHWCKTGILIERLLEICKSTLEIKKGKLGKWIIKNQWKHGVTVQLDLLSKIGIFVSIHVSQINCLGKWCIIFSNSHWIYYSLSRHVYGS